MLESIIVDSKGRSSNSTWTLTEITDPALKLSHGGGDRRHETDATTYKCQVSYPEMLSNTVTSYMS